MSALPKPEVILTHESDLDGFLSGVLLQRLAKHLFGTRVRLEAYHYQAWKQRELREKSAWVATSVSKPGSTSRIVSSSIIIHRNWRLKTPASFMTPTSRREAFAMICAARRAWVPPRSTGSSIGTTFPICSSRTIRNL